MLVNNKLHLWKPIILQPQTELRLNFTLLNEVLLKLENLSRFPNHFLKTTRIFGKTN